MCDRVQLGLGAALAAVFVGVATLPAAAASSASDADALAQKFIDGPRSEAKAISAEKQQEKLRLKELDALSAKLLKARNRRPKEVDKKQSKSSPNGPGLRGFSRYSAPLDIEPKKAERRAGPQRVAVLLSLQAGQRGTRRFQRSAEPIICFEARCFIGAGPGRRAVEMTRREALGPTNAVAVRAGACRHTPRCVFRNIPVSSAQAWLQPIDLGWIRHDRREPVAIAADPTCRVEKQRLTCERAIQGQDYRLWLVPENVAQEAGTDLLELALAGGLRPTRRQAALDQMRAPGDAQN